MSNVSKQEERYKRITEAKIYPLLWRMALPSMIGMIVSSVYSMTDTFFIGRLDRTELTASVGVAFSFIAIIQAIGFWFGYGSGNYISRQLGKKNAQEAEVMASTGLVLSVVVGVIIHLLGLIFLKPLVLLLGGGISDGMMEATVSYLRITLVSVPFMLAANVLYNELRLQGSARDSMVGLMVGMLLNMILDPILILTFDMGVAGAALASLIGQVCGFFILWYFTGKNGNVPINIRNIKFDFGHLKEILSGGAPNFCRQGISSISTVLVNQAAGAFGESAIAGVTVALRILAMGYALVIGFGQGFQPICAINYGAGKYRRIKEAFRDTLVTATAFLIIATIIIVFKADNLLSLFSSEDAVREIGASILKAQCTVLPFMGYYILIGMLFQNIGRFGAATLVTIAENGTFLIPAVLIMPHFFGLNGLIWCKAVASICAFLFSLVVGTRVWRKDLNERGV
ncbi:MATE family efflux transporter [Acetobacterium carbinolicum]|uniref:MATE family efflux transporter n=1 Tax=Acetobacterium carbinolicum TaxID=52690 RepID=UPI0039BF4674